MNCKPGDLAIHVRTGTIVNVLRLHVDQSEVFVSIDGYKCSVLTDVGTSFVCESIGSPIFSKYSNEWFNLYPLLDSGLKPIRDNDKEDETIAWAGKPKTVKA